MAGSLEMNIANLILHNADLYPTSVAVSVGGHPHATYGRLARRAMALSRHLRIKRGLAAGSRIALAMRNSPAFWEVLFGVWHAGMIAVPVNPKLHPREIAFILGHSQAALCFVTSDVAEPMTAPECAVINCDGGEYRHLRDAEGPHDPAFPARPDDPAWLFYTSGTTGRPKGATLSHHNLMMMILAHLADIDDLGPDDCIVHAAPQSHGSGLLGLVHFAVGANNIIPESGGFDPAEIAGLLDRYSGLTLFAAPTMLNRMARAPEFTAQRVRRLRSIVYGGAPMYRADLDRAIDVFGTRLVQIYGQGESPMTITGLDRQFHRPGGQGMAAHPLNSVGRARWGVEVRVVDPQGRTLPPGEAGEVVVRGDVVMAGYWRDPGATAAALREGWLHTGDIGSFDGEGFLTLLDRSKDLIISGGSNIYPREVEETLLRHPAVTEVSVVGRPDPEWGEAVIAFVVAGTDAPPTTAELDAWCLDHIARFKRPRAYVFLDGLPKSPTGKIAKTDLRQMALRA